MYNGVDQRFAKFYVLGLPFRDVEIDRASKLAKERGWARIYVPTALRQEIASPSDLVRGRNILM